jgi:hypothetical protein
MDFYFPSLGREAKFGFRPPLYFERGFFDREVNMDFEFSFKGEEGFGCRGARACLVCEF